MFGSSPATNVIVQSSTVLTADAPAGVGVVDVTVTTFNGTSAITPFDRYSYTLTPPSITSINPNNGPETGGTAVNIQGTGFLPNSTVFFGITPATSVVVHSFSSLTAIAPPGVGTVDITVVTSMGESAITPADRFTYVPEPPPPPIPTVTSVVPSFGPQSGGNMVTINGTNFIPGITTVNFGLIPATNVVVLSSTVLTVIAPAGSSIVDVRVTTPNGTSPITSFDRYSYDPPVPPTIISLTPNFGPETGGTSVTIEGVGFVTGDTAVFFGTTPAANVVVNSFSILTVIAPPGIGVVDVTVVTSMGQSIITPADSFTYLSVPTPPLPPSNFIGVVKKNKFLNKTEYVLKAKWDASPSTDVVLYRIYKNGHLVDEILAGSPLIFTTCLDSKNAAKNGLVAQPKI